MGKVFITDEVNDMYTANVTNAGRIMVEDGGGAFYKFTSAESEVSGVTAGIGAGKYLKSIIFGQYPATAASFTLYDTTISAGNVSGFGTSGANVIATFVWDVGAASASVCGVANYSPQVFPLNVYLTSGLTVQHGVSATTAYLGQVENVTVIYQ